MVISKAKQLNEKLKRNFNEMATLKPEDTGIDGITLFCSPEMGSHWIRVKAYDKVANVNTVRDPHITYSVGVNPEEKAKHGKVKISNKDASKSKEWIHDNQVALTDFWHGRINTKEFNKLIIKYGEE